MIKYTLWNLNVHYINDTDISRWRYCKKKTQILMLLILNIDSSIKTSPYPTSHWGVNTIQNITYTLEYTLDSYTQMMTCQNFKCIKYEL